MASQVVSHVSKHWLTLTMDRGIVEPKRSRNADIKSRYRINKMEGAWEKFKKIHSERSVELAGKFITGELSEDEFKRLWCDRPHHSPCDGRAAVKFLNKWFRANQA